MVISTKSIANLVGNTLIATFFRSLLIRAVKDEIVKGENNNDKYLSDRFFF